MTRTHALWALLFTLLHAPLSSWGADASLHKDVQAALDYELPANDCDKPALVAQASNVVDGEGARQQTDVDSYTIDRYERKQKRWESCMNNYRQRLMKDFEKLKDSAQHGLTQAQADIVLGKMKMLQTVYLSPDGRLEDP